MAKCSVYTVSYNGVWQNVKYILSLSCPVGCRYGEMFSRHCLFLTVGYGKMFTIHFLFFLQPGMAKYSVYTFFLGFLSNGVWQNLQYTLSFLSIGVWQNIQYTLSLSCPIGYGKIFNIHFLLLVHWGNGKIFSVHFLFLVQWGMAKSSVYTFSFLSIGVWQNIQCAFSLSCPMGYGKMFFDQPNPLRVYMTLALSVLPELERNNSYLFQ